MNELLWFIAGAISSFIINLITEALFPSIRRNVKLFFLRKRASSLKFTRFSPTKIVVGNLTLDWIVLAVGEFDQNRIHCTYKNKHHQLPPELMRIKDELIRDMEKKKTKGETAYFNGPMYKLVSFDVGYRDVGTAKKCKCFVFIFAQLIFFHHLLQILTLVTPYATNTLKL